MKKFKCEKKAVKTKSREFDFLELYEEMNIYGIQREFNELVETLTEGNSEIRYEIDNHEYKIGGLVFYREETNEEYQKIYDTEYTKYCAKLAGYIRLKAKHEIDTIPASFPQINS